jgi:hypothetical protein
MDQAQQGERGVHGAEKAKKKAAKKFKGVRVEKTAQKKMTKQRARPRRGGGLQGRGRPTLSATRRGTRLSTDVISPTFQEDRLMSGRGCAGREDGQK